MDTRAVQPFPLIVLAGGPLERGRSYGRQAKQRIHGSIAHYKAQASRNALEDDGIAAVVRSYVPLVERFEKNYVEEMRGIAEGAGVSFEDIFLLNARTEIMKLAVRPDLRAQLARTDVPDGCTGVTVLPSATRDGHLIHAQNWDWKVECVQTCVVLRISRDDGPDVLTLTEAGMLARSGFNAAGIAITGNNLECDRDYSQIGVPLALIRRKALESSSLALAMHAVYATPKSGSNNMAVSHSEGIVINFECAPDETFQVHAKDGLLVHANHWVNVAALSKLRDTGVALSPCSLYREMRVRDVLAPHVGSITTESVKTALLDHFQSPWSVCRPPRQDLGRDTRSATVATVIMQPALGVLEIAPLSALSPRFTTYQLTSAEQAYRRQG
jgi:isopenicillin-N N-acyltransferase-like protein